MRFQLAHKLATFAVVATAIAAALTAGLLSTEVVSVALLAGAIAWWTDPSSRIARAVGKRPRLARLIGIGSVALIVASLAVTIYRAALRLPEVDLVPVLDLVVFLAVVKLYQRRSNRDHVHICVLAFLLVIAAGAAAQTVFFVVVFAAYVVVATTALVLLHLRREMEENYLVKHSGYAPSQQVGVARVLNSRRVVGAPFFVGMAMVGGVVFVGSLIAFALFPRVGGGFTLASARRAGVIGFSDEVTLGAPGFLSLENDAVALRAVVPRVAALRDDRARRAELEVAYWRGTVYDTYAHGRWLRSQRNETRTVLEDHGLRVLVGEAATQPGPSARGSLRFQDVYRTEIDLVGVAVPVAFALDQPVAFELPTPKLGAVPDVTFVGRWGGEVSLRSPTSTGTDAADAQDDFRVQANAHYVAYSRDPLGRVTALAGRPLASVPSGAIAAYLALPLAPTHLATRIADLGVTITAGHATPASKVVAVVEWLQRTHGYSLDVRRTRPDLDPVEEFLFSARAGNCEYFASAAVLLLRSVGVPTRYVNGFLGGEWNPVGEHITVRQNRAHSWAEAYLGELGWMRVDATPPAPPRGSMGRLRQLIDSVEFAWGRWVMSYDLGRQVSLARRLVRSLSPERSRAAGDSPATDRSWPRWVTVALAGGAVVFVWRRLRRRTRAGGSAGPALGVGVSGAVGRLYRRCLERLEEAGHGRLPFETPRELAARVVAADLESAEAFVVLTELYIRARFSGRKAADRSDELAELARELQRLGLRRTGATGPGAIRAAS